jgi:uncharacterized damage-inducible protein DinB
VGKEKELLVDAFERVRGAVRDGVSGLSAEELAFRVDAEANSIGWLAWHLTRVQDDHVAAMTASEQRWTADGWRDRFGLPFDASAIGYGQGSDEVAQVRPESPDLLIGYHDAVHRATLGYLHRLDEAELDRVVDESFDPPVTAAVRLVSVISDDLQHVGQIGFLRGMVLRRRAPG